MLLDSQAVADIVVAAVKSATGTLLERQAVQDQCIKDLQARVAELTELRDRMVAVEVKAERPMPTVDLAPLLERMTGFEAKLAAAVETDVPALRQELAMLHARPEPPAAPDLSPLVERMARTEARVEVLGDVRDRVVTLEAKGDGLADVRQELKAVLETKETANPALSDLRERLLSLEHRMPDDTLAQDVVSLCERVAVVETKSAIPGPPGKDGADGREGRDGVNGKDGRDGLGFEDLSAEFDGDRTVLLKFSRGSESKAFPITLPFMRYEGIWKPNRTYVPGDTVTRDGSIWHANEITNVQPGAESKAWTLACKRGSNGRDLRDEKDIPPLPVVKVGA